MPAHPLFRRLLKLTGRPLAAPSANLFGYISPTTAEHVRAGSRPKIGHILDGGHRTRPRSTISICANPAARVCSVPVRFPAKPSPPALGRPIALAGVRPVAPASEAQVAPGLLLRHYSPRTPLTLRRRLIRRRPSQRPR